MDYYYSYHGAHSDASVSNNGKKKKKPAKGGGSAAPVKLSTDPQSVAARERRHRISERFKTLQRLVPGGAKLDTVSMLDEAIHYVKFLKTQIWLHETLICGSGGADHAYSESFQQELHCPQSHEWSQCCHSSSVEDNINVAAPVHDPSSWLFDMPEVQFADETTLF